MFKRSRIIDLRFNTSIESEQDLDVIYMLLLHVTMVGPFIIVQGKLSCQIFYRLFTCLLVFVPCH